jgi:hypothetical protein
VAAAQRRQPAHEQEHGAEHHREESQGKERCSRAPCCLCQLHGVHRFVFVSQILAKGECRRFVFVSQILAKGECRTGWSYRRRCENSAGDAASLSCLSIYNVVSGERRSAWQTCFMAYNSVLSLSRMLFCFSFLPWPTLFPDFASCRAAVSCSGFCFVTIILLFEISLRGLLEF